MKKLWTIYWHSQLTGKNGQAGGWILPDMQIPKAMNEMFPERFGHLGTM